MNSLSGLIVNSNEIDKERSDANHARNKKRTDDHLSDPKFTTKAGIETTTKEAINRRAHRVHENHRIEERATSKRDQQN